MFVQWCLQKHLSPWIFKKRWTLWYACHFPKLDVMLFLIVCMPYIDSNIPRSIFCFALVGEFIIIARNSLLYKDLDKKLWWHLENSLLAHLPVTIPSHLLGYSNKGRNSSEDIKLETYFLLYYKIKYCKVCNYLVFYNDDYIKFFVLNCTSITVYFWPANYLEKVISNIFTVKAGTCEKWDISLEDFFSGRREVVLVLILKFKLSNL